MSSHARSSTPEKIKSAKTENRKESHFHALLISFKKKPATSTITVSLLLTLIIAFVAAIPHQNWLSMLITLAIAILIAIPMWFERWSKIVLPAGLQIFLVCFVYATLFLGDAQRYYYKYFWWDTVLHTSSGLGFGIAGFLLLYIIYKSGKTKATPAILAMFAFCFAVAVGTVWEVFEFVMDTMFGFNMQGDSLFDTMKDLIVDSIGGLVAAVMGYLYLKRKTNTLGFSSMMNEFKRNNPRLFPRLSRRIRFAHRLRADKSANQR